MEIVKRVKPLVLINGMMLLFLVTGLGAGLSKIMVLTIFIIAEIGLTVVLFFFVINPLIIFEKALDGCNKKEIGSEKILESISDEIIFMRKIKFLVEKCSNQKIKENSAEMFDKQAKLTALQSQINPHFLYNTLESIRGQALIDENIEIAKMVEALASFFRYSISRKGSLVTLRDELANIKNYMMIQRYRFNNRFSLEILIDEEDEYAYDYLIPKLILQPVVENAIFHGLEESLEGGKVVIEVIVTESNLILTVSDNGKGMDNQTLTELNGRIRNANQYLEDNKSEKQRNTGIALPNIHKRIQLLFGEEYGLHVYSTLHQGTDVEITIPVADERNIK